ncbi:hypothetical protein EU538_10400 [Candidatus Thorarchaeota archaeon]|nr:MAG: hypothetical protein EU538_10400 [Candidatus Thorarchaeota archaeon]
MEQRYDITAGGLLLQDFAQLDDLQRRSRDGSKRLQDNDCQDIIEQFWSAISQDEEKKAGELLMRARGLHLDIAATLLQDRGVCERSYATTLLKKLGENESKDAFDIDNLPAWGERLLDVLHEQVIVPLTTAVSKALSTDELSLHSLRRETGSFYTPAAIARYISGQTLNYWLQYRMGFSIAGRELDTLDRATKLRALQALRRVRIVDPALGAGIFLVEAANWLLILRRALDDTQPVSDIKWQIVNENLFGVDILQDSVAASRRRLVLWASSNERPFQEALAEKMVRSIRQGNSIVGATGRRNEKREVGCNQVQAFKWANNFPQTFANGGFDIVIGNPPYGNILSDTEKEAIAADFRWNVSGGRTGTWNAASLFLVRGRELLNSGGHLGMLLPNSILRVGQFQKTREFMLQHLDILEIRDEGSPIDDITLELFSLIAGVPQFPRIQDVLIRSRRSGIRREKTIPIANFHESDIFVLYHDEILDLARRRGKTRLLSASRGRDIPSAHVREKQDDTFSIPYATSGRSIRRYRFDENYLKYADDWFRNDVALTESYESVFLAATKNLPYPRVILKPKGVIHGGGIVKISIHDSQLSPASVGMVLNSAMVRYLCVRYLTNYSELTTCLNTGIMDELPVVLPECQSACGLIFDELQRRCFNGRVKDSLTRQLDALADALVYEAYLLDDSHLARAACAVLDRKRPVQNREEKTIEIVRATSSLVSKTMDSEWVKAVECSPRMNRETRRY